MTEKTDEQKLPCIICDNIHPLHLSLQVTQTGLSAGLTCITPHVRKLLNLPNPEDAEMHLDPRPIEIQPFQSQTSNLFAITMMETPVHRDSPLIKDRHFIEAVNHAGLSTIVRATPPNRTVIHRTAVNNIPVDFHISPYTSVVGRFNIWLDAVTNNPEPTVATNARMIWKNLNTPQGQQAHTRIIDIINQAHPSET